MNIAIVKALWNQDINDLLENSCEQELLKQGAKISKYTVSGAVELPVLAKQIIEKKKVDAVICIGTIIKRETDHYTFVAYQASYGCQKVAVETGTPVIFGVLTTNNKEQALVRANGEHSFSGKEWAEAAVQLVNTIKSL